MKVYLCFITVAAGKEWNGIVAFQSFLVICVLHLRNRTNAIHLANSTGYYHFHRRHVISSHWKRGCFSSRSTAAQQLHTSCFMSHMDANNIPYARSHEYKSETLKDANDGTSAYIKAACFCVKCGLKCAWSLSHLAFIWPKGPDDEV